MNVRREDTGTRHGGWSSLRSVLPGQLRTAATFQQKDAHTFHDRKNTSAKPELRQPHEVLGALYHRGA